MTFREWMLDQMYRDDDIGWLAGDIAVDEGQDGLHSFEEAIDRAIEIGASEVCLQVFEQADAEFKAFTDRDQQQRASG